MFEHRVEDYLHSVERLSDLEQKLEEVVDCVVQLLRQGGRLFVCADHGTQGLAQDFVEWLAPVEPGRPCAFALVTRPVQDTPDYSASLREKVQEHVRGGDVVLAIASHPAAPGLDEFVGAAHSAGAIVVALAANHNEALVGESEFAIVVWEGEWNRAYRAHVFVLQYLCDRLLSTFKDGSNE